MRARGLGVLVVDSDESNPGLYRMLGLNKRPSPLLELVGGKKNVFPTFAEDASPSKSVLAQDTILPADLPAQYVEETDGIRLVCIGKILQALEGCACPMGALSREFLKRLRLPEGEVAIVDMEAGIEHFGRGIETSVDAVLIVVEPSFDSMELAAKIQTLAHGVGTSDVHAVLNKIPSEEVGGQLADALRARGVGVVGSIGYDTDVHASSLEGRSLPGARAVAQVGEIAEALLSGEGVAES
jgi:CO dehydrogenase maturation factor